MFWMLQKSALIQEIWLGSPDCFSLWEGGVNWSGDETNLLEASDAPSITLQQGGWDTVHKGVFRFPSQNALSAIFKLNTV